jgi:peptidoglycan hydrolase-like protein with peptidoglycan-binding domain
MKKLFYLVFLIMISFAFLPGQMKALLPCDCLEDRILDLRNPPMEGEDVLLLQERLRELGYYSGNLDGRYDAGVARAVAGFQVENHLEPDGVVEVMTWKTLGKGVLAVTGAEKTSAPQGKLNIVINTYNRILTLYCDDQPYKTYPVAVGKPSTKSPVGEWAIIHKSKDWGGGFGTRWMGLNVPWGVYGIHGTNKPWAIGGAVSHGCIRMHNSHVEELYNWLPLKTRVEIIGQRLPVEVNRVLKPGQTGLSVMQLQDNLLEIGINSGYRDARYGPTTEEAVKELESQFALKIDGVADWNILYLLGLPGD